MGYVSSDSEPVRGRKPRRARSGSSNDAPAAKRRRRSARDLAGSSSSEAELATTLFTHGRASLRGKRPTQEDVAVVLQVRRGPLLATFAAVLDGHGGNTCSKRAAALLEEKFHTRCAMDPAEFLTSSLREIDEDLLSDAAIYEGCGTTLTCVLAQKSRRPVRHLDVCVGNLGDSRVLKIRLGRNAGLCEESGTGGGVTVDHKPSSHEEKRRIESCGDVVVTLPHISRINGELALSRGLGDRRWKKTKNREGETAVSAVPDVFRTRCRRNEFLVLIHLRRPRRG